MLAGPVIMTDLSEVAKFAIQVTVLPDNKVNSRGAIQIFKKGRYFGEFDEIQYLCPTRLCKYVHTDDFAFSQAEKDWFDKNKPEHIGKWPEATRIRYDQWHRLPVTCPKCGHLSLHRDDLPESAGFNQTNGRIAEEIESYYRELGGFADISMVIFRHPQMMMQARKLIEAKANKAELKKTLDLAREKHHVFYAWKDIVKDITAGSNVLSRINAMLNA